MKFGLVLRRTLSLARARLFAVRSSFVDVFVAMTFVTVPVDRGRAVTLKVTLSPFFSDPTLQTIGRARLHEPLLTDTLSGAVPVVLASTTVTSSAVSGPRLVSVPE